MAYFETKILATSNAKSDVGFLLGDPDFLLGQRNFAPILLSYRDPHLGYLGFFGGFVNAQLRNIISIHFLTETTY